MYGCFLVPPDDGGADLGVLFWHKDGYSTACGHGTIALGAWAVESGRVPAPADGDALSATNIRDFLRDYHATVLSDPRTAYDTMTGPTLQANVGYETYAGFWGRFSDVKVKDVQAEDGSTTATANLEFTENGDTFTEAHQFTLAVADDGRLLMDVDVQTG